MPVIDKTSDRYGRKIFIGDIAPKGREGTYMGYFYVAFFLGFGIGPLIGGFVSNYFGIKNAFYTMGGFNFISFVLAFMFLPKAEVYRQRNNAHISYTTMIRRSKIIKGLFTFRFTNALARGIFACFFTHFRWY